MVQGDAQAAWKFWSRTHGGPCVMTSGTWPRLLLCRQLECGQAVAAPMGAHFGVGSGKIVLDNMQCVGSKSHLEQCMHGGEAVHNCGHQEDASVICTGEWLASPRTSPLLCPFRHLGPYSHPLFSCS